jgi:hypothetical protein
MKTQSWFQKETSTSKRSSILGAPLFGKHKSATSEASKFASRLRPHDLIAMLTHHYTRVRSRGLPKVKTSISVMNKTGAQAVTISFG